MEKVILIFIICLSAQGANLKQWEDAVVKIKSFPCAHRSPVFEGSGFIVKENKKTYVLTSEHILLPGNQTDICIEAANDTVGTINLNIEKNSYIHGLTKLKIQGNQPKVGIRLSKNNNKSQSKIWALGYPVGSEVLQVLNKGELLSSKSQRSLIPASNTILEVTNLPVEFGMSGGLLLSGNENNLEFLGMLSHQYLERKPGKKTIAVTMENNNSMAQTDITLALPHIHIQDWINQEIVEDLSWKRVINPNLDQVLLEYGPLQFEQVFFESSVLQLGGGDGVGIGGIHEEKDLDGKIIAIKVQLNPSNEIKRTVGRIKSPVLKQWYQWLLQGQDLYIVQVHNQTKDQTETISSFDQLVTLWLRENYIPMVHRGNIEQLDGKIKEILVLTNEIKAKLSDIDSKNTDLTLWKNNFLKQLVLLETNLNYTLENIESNKSSGAWAELYNYDFDLALELEIAIESIKKLFR